MRQSAKLVVPLFTLLAMLIVSTYYPARGARASTPGHTALAEVCTVLGTYFVGPRGIGIVPQPKGPQPGGAPALYPYPYATGVLTGTVTLSSYSPCGVPTAGSFAVHALLRPPYPYPAPPRPGGFGSGAVIAQPAIFGTTVLTATGTFLQDPGHPKDPGYVSVSGTISYGRYGYGCAPICDQPQGRGAIACPPDGCGQPGKPVVSRVATFTGITGYLRLQARPPAAVALLFLPPPEPATSVASASQPISIYGLHRAP